MNASTTFPGLDPIAAREQAIREAEARIVGSALRRLDNLDHVPGLEPQHLGNDTLRAVLAVLLAKRADGAAEVDPFALAAEMGGTVSAAELVQIEQQADGITPGRMPTLLGTVIEGWQARELRRVSPGFEDGPVGDRIEAARRLLDRIEAAAPGRAAGQKKLAHVDVVGVWSDPSPPPEFVWGKYLPRGTTTLFSAHGGTGKSTIGLMLTVAAAAGKPLFGVPTEPTPAIFVSLEDGAAIVRHRLGAICRWLEVDPKTLAGKLFVVDGTEHPELYGADNRNGDGMTSDTYAELRELVESTQAGLVVIDNASDAYASDEIVRRHVRAFIRHLNLIGMRYDAAMVLLSHVNANTSRNQDLDGDEDYSGSTAWHNSVRSRIALKRKKGTDLLIMQHQKVNYGKKQSPLMLEWPEDGYPRAYLEGDAPDFDTLNALAEGRQQDNNAIELLKLLAEYESRGQYASPSPTAKNNVFALLKADPQLKRLKLGRDAVSAIVTQCHRSGWIEPLEYRADYKDRQRWAVTEAGRAWAGLSNPPCPPSPLTPHTPR